MWPPVRHEREGATGGWVRPVRRYDIRAGGPAREVGKQFMWNAQSGFPHCCNSWLIEVNRRERERWKTETPSPIQFIHPIPTLGTGEHSLTYTTHVPTALGRTSSLGAFIANVTNT